MLIIIEKVWKSKGCQKSGGGEGMGVFQIKKNPSGRFYFVFQKAHDFCIVSKSYTDRALLEDSIVQLRKFSDISEVFTHETHKSYPCFLIQEDDQQFSFHAFGLKGEMVMTSMPFQTLEACQQAIDILKTSARDSKIQDLT